MHRILIILLFLVAGVGCTDSQSEVAETTPPDHSKWTALLSKHVDENGMVDYDGFLGDSTELRMYLKLLSSNPPSEKWTEEEQLAYWINVYNAFTIDLILNHYPLTSIKEIGSSIQIPFINSPWDIVFFEIGGVEYDLNAIEHDILRKEFEEPRIHFAINCASMSCPLLLDEAYTAEKLEDQLQMQSIAFINDPFRNQITETEVRISKIFNWFRGDFIKEGKLIEYLNKYSKVKIQPNAKIKYLEYDWRLNSQID